MKTKALLSIITLSILFFTGCAEKDDLVTITTEYGDMKVILFDETPQHKETFLKMAQAGKYDSTIFHRVMKDFMVQGGDINQKPGNTEPENTLIPAEFNDKFIHKKGMLAGARTPDNVNPEKKSGTQFYIVQGTKYSRTELEQQNESSYYSVCVARLNQIFQKGEQRDLQNKLIELQKNNDIQAVEETVYSSVPVIEAEFGKIPKKTYTEEQYEAYETIGGAPFLDWDYTVYGQVIDGLEIIDMIANQPTDGADKPDQDIYMTVTVEKMAKSKISRLYDYTYRSE
jgi:peptidyl-prolyl cis-trans isomerase B (cyclophilin B)